MEFISIGGLVKGITVTDIMNGVSQSRNTVVADVFYRLSLIESYGTGIQKIMESYENAVEKPTIQSAPASFVVMLPRLKSKENYYVTQEAQEAAVLKTGAVRAVKYIKISPK